MYLASSGLLWYLCGLGCDVMVVVSCGSCGVCGCGIGEGLCDVAFFAAGRRLRPLLRPLLRLRLQDPICCGGSCSFVGALSGGRLFVVCWLRSVELRVLVWRGGFLGRFLLGTSGGSESSGGSGASGGSRAFGASGTSSGFETSAASGRSGGSGASGSGASGASASPGGGVFLACR